MPVADFNQNGVLPPHNGNPIFSAGVSPFQVTVVDLCKKFSTSAERRSILSGFLAYRKALRELGILDGFHWVNGSFTEDVERLRGRGPSDIDIVTFYLQVPLPTDPAVAPILDVVINHAATKRQFHVDHQLVNLNWSAQQIVQSTAFWCGLFSHQRDTEVWKGILQIDLNTPEDDIAAAQHLASLEQS